MRAHSEGRLTLRTRQVQPITVPPVDADVVRQTREALKMSRHVFGKSSPNPVSTPCAGTRCLMG
jgi:hypothetical protein